MTNTFNHICTNKCKYLLNKKKKCEVMRKTVNWTNIQGKHFVQLMKVKNLIIVFNVKFIVVIK